MAGYNVKELTFYLDGQSAYSRVLVRNARSPRLLVYSDIISEHDYFIGQHVLGPGKRRRSQTGVEECAQQPAHVLQSRFYKEIQIECCPWHAMNDCRDPADDGIANAMAFS